jgi:glycosyltransferase involved in cell wall biosynthesis
LFAPVLKKAGIPLLFWTHDIARTSNWLERKATRHPPDRAIANSCFISRTLPDLFPGAPAEVVYCPIPARPGDPARRQEIRREFSTPDNAVVILMACRMEEWKGHPLLLDGLSRLKDDPRWQCWIAGGPQRPAEEDYLRELHEREARLGLAGRIAWLGQRNDVPDLLAAADIHCQPNLGAEPFGIVFVEALQAGRPVVSTRHGGVMEIVDDSCGLLVEPNRPDLLAGALARLIDDPVWRKQLGAAGPSRARSLCDPGEQLHKLKQQIALSGAAKSAR